MIVSYADTNLPTPKEIRERWCFGLPLTNEYSESMSDPDIQAYLDSSISQVERRLGIYLKPTVIVCNPDARGLIKGEDYDKEEPPYDYAAELYRQWGHLQLRERPIQRLISFKLVLTNGQEIIDFTKHPSWLKLYKSAGQIRIVPNAGDPVLYAALAGTATTYPFMTGNLYSNIPQMLHVDYVAGYAQFEIPADVRNVVAKIAAVDVLGIAGDAMLAGVASLSTSIDGLSESFSTTASATNATYGAHILQYQKEIDAFFSPKHGGARTSERGFTFTSL